MLHKLQPKAFAIGVLIDGEKGLLGELNNSTRKNSWLQGLEMFGRNLHVLYSVCKYTKQIHQWGLLGIGGSIQRKCAVSPSTVFENCSCPAVMDWAPHQPATKPPRRQSLNSSPASRMEERTGRAKARKTCELR